MELIFEMISAGPLVRAKLHHKALRYTVHKWSDKHCVLVLHLELALSLFSDLTVRVPQCSSEQGNGNGLQQSV